MYKRSLALLATILALGLGSCAAPPTAVSTPEGTAVMATIHQFVDSFNAGDVAKAMALCTDPIAILDECPPYEWHGPGASAKWLNDYVADAKQNGITDGVVTLHAPRVVDVHGDRAYVVAGTDHAFKRQGEPAKQTDATFTFALQKTNAGWRITGWCWSKN